MPLNNICSINHDININGSMENRIEGNLNISFLGISNEFLELGDIVISVPTAIRQAKDNNVDLFRELRWLATHGLLHLLGWDHCDQESLAQMLVTQEQLLDLRGIL